MGVVPCFLKFYFFFFFHLPPGISQAFPMSSVSSKDWADVSQCCSHFATTVLHTLGHQAFFLPVPLSVWASAEQSVHLKNTIKPNPPPKLPSEIPCKFTSKFEAALSFFSNSETLSSTLLSLCRFCVTCRVLEGVLLYIKNRLLEASSVTIQVKSPSNKLNQFNDFKKRNFQPILPSIAEKNPSKTDTLRKWKQQIHLLLKSIKC